MDLEDIVVKLQKQRVVGISEKRKVNEDLENDRELLRTRIQEEKEKEERLKNQKDHLLMIEEEEQKRNMAVKSHIAHEENLLHLPNEEVVERDLGGGVRFRGGSIEKRIVM
jgi:hypothetical protein